VLGSRRKGERVGGRRKSRRKGERVGGKAGVSNRNVEGEM
jgi:hypothetical protein